VGRYQEEDNRAAAQEDVMEQEEERDVAFQPEEGETATSNDDVLYVDD